MLPPLSEDPRLDRSIDLFNRGDYEEAADIAEELFFEATGEEKPIARVLLQFLVGMVHVEQQQTAPALERIGVGLDESAFVKDWCGIDGRRLVAEMEEVVRQLRSRGEIRLPRIHRPRQS